MCAASCAEGGRVADRIEDSCSGKRGYCRNSSWSSDEFSRAEKGDLLPAAEIVPARGADVTGFVGEIEDWAFGGEGGGSLACVGLCMVEQEREQLLKELVWFGNGKGRKRREDVLRNKAAGAFVSGCILVADTAGLLYLWSRE